MRSGLGSLTPRSDFDQREGNGHMHALIGVTGIGDDPRLWDWQRRIGIRRNIEVANNALFHSQGAPGLQIERYFR